MSTHVSSCLIGWPYWRISLLAAVCFHLFIANSFLLSYSHSLRVRRAPPPLPRDRDTEIRPEKLIIIVLYCTVYCVFRIIVHIDYNIAPWFCGFLFSISNFRGLVKTKIQNPKFRIKNQESSADRRQAPASQPEPRSPPLASRSRATAF